MQEALCFSPLQMGCPVGQPQLAAQLLGGFRAEIGCVTISLIGPSAWPLCLPAVNPNAGRDLPAWPDHGDDEDYG